MRTCLGCMQSDRKDAMVRIAASGATIAIDPDKRAPGRGGYLHPHADCLARFQKSKVKVFKSLRRPIERNTRAQIVAAISSRLDREQRVE